MENIVAELLKWLANAGVKILVAFVVIFISFPVINHFTNVIKKICIKKKIDKTIGKSLRYVFKFGTKILVICFLLGYLGFDTASISALIATLGLGVGLAVQGSLSNFAGGVLIILTRPFKIDDYIETQGISGTIEDIHIIYTILRTPDNKVIHIPNGTLANSTITNYSSKDTRRVDFTFSIAYDADYLKAEQIILDICKSHSLVLDDPAPVCRLSEYADSAIKLVLRVWTLSSDYWNVYFDINESVKNEFDAAGISIPYNQLDVHIDNKN